MSYGRGPDRYLTFEGDVLARSVKALRFQAYNWAGPEWIPISQLEIVQGKLREGERATIKIKEWLCKKNGWTEDGEPEAVDERMNLRARDLDDEIPF